ncbi:transposase [Kitasatospora sp. NPDC057940]|uniref:transposase n=1 Tax=Kitasatospora sp. NPDC057940 TaxID=3346285 RepID=UPI0036DD888D
MRAGELALWRGRLEEFAAEVFAPLARCDQRVKGWLYLRGLLLEGRRKSMQPMAERLGVDHQGLQQFMTSSTWPVEDAEPHRPPYGGLGPRLLPRYRTRPVSLREHVLAAGRGAGRSVTWRKGSKAAMSSHFVLLRVRLAGRRPKPAADGTIPLTWLIAQWPENEAEPVKYWISNLPADIPAKDLIRLAKSRWRIEHDYRELKTRLGLDHFEGRSYTGWHRHVTLASAAHLFLTEQRALPKAQARA